MVRRPSPTPSEDAPDDTRSTPSLGERVRAWSEPDLATLPIVGLTRRRMAILLGVALVAWVIILFARQVTDAAAATGRAEAMVAANDARQAEVDGLQRELELIQQPAFVASAGPRLRPRGTARDPVLAGGRRIAAALGRARLGLVAGRGPDLGQPARALADPPVRPERLTDHSRDRELLTGVQAAGVPPASLSAGPGDSPAGRPGRPGPDHGSRTALPGSPARPGCSVSESRPRPCCRAGRADRGRGSR